MTQANKHVAGQMIATKGRRHWQLRTDWGGLIGDINGLAPDVKEATAKRIARTWNAHDDMLEALKQMVEAFHPFTMKPIGEDGSPARLEQEAQIKAHRQAIAAIAKAESLEQEAQIKAHRQAIAAIAKAEGQS